MFGKGDFFESIRHFACTEEREIFFYFKLRKNYFCDDNEDSDLFPATGKTEVSLIIVETWAVKSLCDGNSSKDL